MKNREGLLILFLIGLFLLGSCGKAQIETTNEVSTEIPDTGVATNTPLPKIEVTPPEERNNTATQANDTSATPEVQDEPTQTPTDTGSDVLQLEEALHALGYYEVGLVDGNFDHQTALAIMHLQWMNGLPVTGDLEADVLDDLIDGKLSGVTAQPPFPAKSFSMNNTAFMEDGVLTGRLVDLGYLDSSDPSFNPFAFDTATDQAVRNFQTNNHLTANGVVDFAVWQALFHPAVVDANGESAVNLPDTTEGWASNSFPLLNQPTDLLFDGKYLWVLHSNGEYAHRNLLVRVDPNEAVINQPPPIMVGDPERPDNEIVEMVYDGNRIWLLLPQSFDPPELINLIPESGEVYFRTAFTDCGWEGCFPASALGFDGSKLWATMNNRAWAINRSTGKAYLSYEIGWLAHGEMVFDGRCMWMGSEVGLTTFHTGGMNHCPSENIAYEMPSGPVAYDGKRLWSVEEGWNTIRWLDVESGIIGDPIKVGNNPTDLVFDGQMLWVANGGDNTVQGIDVETGSVGEPIPTGVEPVALAFDGERLWVANAGDRTLQAIEIDDYYIEIIIPTATPIPSLTPTSAATPTPTMPILERSLYLQDSRMNGDDVLILQQRLLELGYTEVGVPDGVFGPMTDEAVRHFQEINGLVVDGIVGPITWEILFSGDAMGP